MTNGRMTIATYKTGQEEKGRILVTPEWICAQIAAAERRGRDQQKRWVAAKVPAAIGAGAILGSIVTVSFAPFIGFIIGGGA